MTVPEKWPGKAGVDVQLAKLRIWGLPVPMYAVTKRSELNRERHVTTMVVYSELSRRQMKARWYLFRAYMMAIEEVIKNKEEDDVRISL